jgi:CBS domain-containing protein
MKAADVMTAKVISISPDASIMEGIRLMLQNHISGLPVIDDAGRVVGIVTEGDFLRRAETGTQRKRPRWLEFITGPGRLAEEYVHAHGRKIGEVMTLNPETATEDTPLDEVVTRMEKRRIKRLPIMRNGRIVGIISRANLLHALASVLPDVPAPPKTDTAIRERIMAALEGQPWAPKSLIDVVVHHGVVGLWGTILDERDRQAIRVVAENVGGIKEVQDHLVWVEPMTGMCLESPADQGVPGTAPVF